MDEILKTVYTDKWYKICIRNSDFSYYQDDDFFGEWVEFRYSGSLNYATTKPMKNYSEEVFQIIFWTAELDLENDPCGYQAYNLEQAKELQEKYYIYPINYGEHSNFAFWLWSTSDFEGAILLDKSIFNETRATDESKVNEFLRKDYTERFNWRISTIDIFKPHKRTDQDGDEMTTLDYVDGYGGIFYDNLNSEYADAFEGLYWKLETDF